MVSTRNRHHILIVEDEPATSEMIGYALRRSGYGVQHASDAYDAREYLADNLPDLVLLDWLLPGVSGLELMCELRSDPRTRRLAIIMVTGRAEESDRVIGLDSGADDYITKPFSTRELIARIQAVFRSKASPANDDEEPLERYGLVLDRAGQRVLAGKREVPLSPSDYRMLAFLMSNPERAFSREQLLGRIWDVNAQIDARAVDVRVRRLRVVLEEFGLEHLVQTVRGRGYRFSSRDGCFRPRARAMLKSESSAGDADGSVRGSSDLVSVSPDVDCRSNEDRGGEQQQDRTGNYAEQRASQGGSEDRA